MLLLGQAHQLGRLGDFQVVDGLESIEEVDARRETVTIVERGRPDIGVGLGVDAATEVGVGVCATLNRRREGGKNGIAAVDLRIAVVGMLDSDFGRVFYGVTHTSFEIHSDGVLGLDAGQGSKNHHQNKKVMFSFHFTHVFTRAKRKHISCQKFNYLKFKDLKFKIQGKV